MSGVARLFVGHARCFHRARTVALGHAESLHLGGVQLQIDRVQQPRRQNRGAPAQRNPFVLITDQHAPRTVGLGLGDLHERAYAGAFLTVEQAD